MSFTASEVGADGSPVPLPVTAEDPCPPATDVEPVVTVVIPTFNRAHLITRALRSVLTQTFTAWEVIVVDDGSEDDTEAVIRSLRDPRIRYCRQPENRGQSAARNRGMGEARGEFIAFLDSDDDWLPEKLELQVARFRELPDTVGLLYTGSQTLADGAPSETFIPSHRGSIYGELLERNVVHGTSGIMIRRAVVERVGYFDERFPAIEDYDYWLRVSARYEIDFISAPLFRYHDAVSAERLSRSIPQNLRARELFYRKHRGDMQRYGVAHLFLEESGRRHLKRSHWDPTTGRKLIRHALAEQPHVLRLYGLFAKSFIPTPVFRLLVKLT